jgi:3-hydroxymyristoyl/3-hydroxydecanoyl-(acyl carrier protein) dehydratase
MTYEVQRVVASDHPSLPGHFPGAPIVPAVVIADEINAALTEWRHDYETAGINTLKFLAPLKPDQPFVISLSTKNEIAGAVDVVCRADARVIVQGRLLVRRRPI